ncbi:hypothetical protein Pan44_25170 [Caulifigura coniformis]|uniref:Resolvase/invertase-type recombinase catalytic domain-containing protein n=1 Tax=Caulifigura coniformis TaxID=2527983 RepID=A0A517SED6_9PLAN|nr:recombinase family protein [Caulifigura coniformis]QDT54484.1 hypothetical protein Pan44_25170 [Caulifigura coniformis]
MDVLEADYGTPPRRSQEYQTPGKPSDFLHHLPALLSLTAVLRIVLYVRVSGRNQARGDNLEHRLQYLRNRLRGLNVENIAEFTEVGSGWKNERPQLANAITFAREHGAVVVAASMDRFVRHADYNSDRDENFLPAVADFQQLLREAGSVRLATCMHPDATPAEIAKEQTKWNPNTGRPKKRKAGALRDRHKGRLVYDQLRWMCILQIPLRRKAAILRVPVSTVQRWQDLTLEEWYEFTH